MEIERTYRKEDFDSPFLKLKRKVSDLLEAFKLLPNHKKAVVVMLLVAFMVLVIGTLSIVLGSIHTFQGDPDESSEELLVEDLQSIDSDIDAIFEDYDLNSIESDVEDIEDLFESYETELSKINASLNDFIIPASSPIAKDEDDENRRDIQVDETITLSEEKQDNEE